MASEAAPIVDYLDLVWVERLLSLLTLDIWIWDLLSLNIQVLDLFSLNKRVLDLLSVGIRLIHLLRLDIGILYLLPFSKGIPTSFPPNYVSLAQSVSSKCFYGVRCH